MDRIGLMGTSWRRGGPEAVARLTVPDEERDAWLSATAEALDLTELVYLATCNRVEIAFVPSDATPLARFRAPFHERLVGRPPASGEAERLLSAWAGEGALEHLLLVTAGLDSARVGEPEITGQVRQALDRSRALGLVGPRLELAFEEAFAVARRVRRETGLGQGRHSLSEIALDPVRAHLGSRTGRVAVVGTSPMCRGVALGLVRDRTPHEVVVVNRTPANARELAAEVNAPLLSLAELRSQPPAVDALVLATAAPEPILSCGDLERIAARTPGGRPLLVVDLAVPPDVAPDAARAAGVQRIGMEELLATADAARVHHADAACRGRELVDEALRELPTRLVERVLSPLFAAVQHRYQDTAREGVERLFAKELTGLGDAEKDAVRTWASTLARRFAHLPTAGLRGVAEKGGMAAVDAFLMHADERLQEAVRVAIASGRESVRAPVTPEGSV